MSNWMNSLALHYEKLRSRYPDEKLLIVFDIDGTILDMRYLMLHVLKAFDRDRGTGFFSHLKISDIDVHEDRVRKLLDRLDIPAEDREKIAAEYERALFSFTTTVEAHCAFGGVMDVIRWFQMQRNTFVALNTGRPESLRFNTLRALNTLGRQYRVHFQHDLLHMKQEGWQAGIPEAKVAGIERFRTAGYRICAVVDNEPDNLLAISKIDPDHEILLLHADTIFNSTADDLPERAVAGKDYDIKSLISEKMLPHHVNLVWSCRGKRDRFLRFLDAGIAWIEVGPHSFPFHEELRQLPGQDITEDECLSLIKGRGKKLKIDLGEGGFFADDAIRMIRDHGFEDSEVWFTADVSALREVGFKILRDLYPSAIIGCPIDSLAPALLQSPKWAREALLKLAGWGINRFSVNWRTPGQRRVLYLLSRWGLETDVNHPWDLESFLQAVLLAPNSVTSDFSFAHWYEGKVTGEDGDDQRPDGLVRTA